MKQKSFWIVLLGFVALLGGAYVLYDRMSGNAGANQLAVQNGGGAVEEESGSGETADGEETPEPVAAPDFTVYDRAGEEVHLTDYLGKPVVLNFWASWCGPCASEMPDIQSAWEEHGNDVEFVIVNMTGMNGETEQSAKAFLAENNYTFPCYFDANNSAASAFGVSSIPQTYLINAEGNIIGAYMGAMDASVLAQGIDMLTGNTSAPAAQ